MTILKDVKHEDLVKNIDLNMIKSLLLWLGNILLELSYKLLVLQFWTSNKHFLMEILKKQYTFNNRLVLRKGTLKWQSAVV